MRTFVILAALGATTLAGCSATTQQTIPGIWIRADGQSGRTNPALAQQFEVDRAACRTGNDFDRACMAQRGYVLVPAQQAEAKAAQLRAQASTSTGSTGDQSTAGQSGF